MRGENTIAPFYLAKSDPKGAVTPMALSSKDYKRILGVIEHIYCEPDRTTLIQGVFERLDRLIGISTAEFFYYDAETRTFQLEDHIRFRGPLKPVELFTAYYWQLHPVVQSDRFLRDLEAHKTTDVISPTKLADTEYGHDFMPLTPHFYELSANLRSQGDLIGSIGIQREKSGHDFTEREQEICNILLPHLSHALHNLDIREALLTNRDRGIILVEADGTPPTMNDEARRALGGRPIGVIPQPSLGSEPVFFTTEAGTFRVCTVPIREGRKLKLVLLEPQPADRDLLEKLNAFGLTKREQEVAVWAVRGLSNKEIADKLFVCEQTVKDHLQGVFEKMKIHRRSELAAKLLGLAHKNISG